jgi:HEAT repeat protein
VIERVLNDVDPRVRANAIEVLEARQGAAFLPMLAERARAAGSNNRERANAIKALHHMKVKTAHVALASMLNDPRPEHRVSALWALRSIGLWQLLNDVGRLAKEDGNLRVRRYALGVLRGVAEMMRAAKAMRPPGAATGAQPASPPPAPPQTPPGGATHTQQKRAG